MHVSRKLACAALLLLFMFMSVSSAQAQRGEVRRTFGLTGSLQGGQAAILVPLWLGDVTVLAPGISLNYVENVTTDIGLLLAPRFYLDMRRVSPYVGLRGAAMINMPNIGSDTTDLSVGVAFGGEYFVNPKFSFGVEAQLNGFIRDVSGVALMAISTAAGVHANVYF